VRVAGELALEKGLQAGAEDADRRLVEATLAGDPSAFEALVDRHWAKVAAVAGRFLTDPNEVEDAVQETFVQAFCHLHGYRGQASVRTWLIRIVANVCRTRRRSFWGRRVFLTETPGGAEGAAANPQRLVEDALLHDEVDAAIHRLPERLRLPLVLYFYEELTGPEIAAALGCNTSTVWSRIYAAYRELRKQLGSGE
jgi:RNA polymerase sigma-70 factor, ECF subfamily